MKPLDQLVQLDTDLLTLLETSADRLRRAEIKNLMTGVRAAIQGIVEGEPDAILIDLVISLAPGRVEELKNNPESAGCHEQFRQP